MPHRTTGSGAPAAGKPSAARWERSTGSNSQGCKRDMPWSECRSASTAPVADSAHARRLLVPQSTATSDAALAGVPLPA